MQRTCTNISVTVNKWICWNICQLGVQDLKKSALVFLKKKHKCYLNIRKTQKFLYIEIIRQFMIQF